MTVALLQAGTFAVGWFAALAGVAGWRGARLPRWLSVLAVVLGLLFVVELALPDPLYLAAPLLTIAWSGCLAPWLWRVEALKR